MLESLEYLSLQYQGLVAVPPEIGQLKNLHTVNVSHNPNLLSVSAQIASLPLKRKSHNICNVSVSPPLTLLSVCAQTTTISLGQHTQHLCSHHQSHPLLRLPPYLSDERHGPQNILTINVSNHTQPPA